MNQSTADRASNLIGPEPRLVRGPVAVLNHSSSWAMRHNTMEWFTARRWPPPGLSLPVQQSRNNGRHPNRLSFCSCTLPFVGFGVGEKWQRGAARFRFAPSEKVTLALERLTPEWENVHGTPRERSRVLASPYGNLLVVDCEFRRVTPGTVKSWTSANLPAAGRRVILIDLRFRGV